MLIGHLQAERCESPHTQLILPGSYETFQIVYKRYASLFFIAEIDVSDNELATLEILHRYVESLDRYFGNVGRLLFLKIGA